MLLARCSARFLALLVPALLCAGPAAAQERRLPNSPAEVKLSYAPVVQKVAPAVVNIYAAKVIENRNPFMDDPFFRRFFGGDAAPQRGKQTSLGSGVIVDARGLVVTNNHVIEGADEVKVALTDRREFEAEIVLKDVRTDLAVLRLKDSNERFPVVELGDSEGLLVGDLVLAIGNPFGVGQTVTHGIVSATARKTGSDADFQSFIQTDAAINPGNSGGALVDLAGRLVGVNTLIFSRSGGSQGIGFAVPVSMVRVVVASALSGGKSVKRPWLGAKLQAVTSEIAEGLGLKRPAGALVATVAPNSPAAKAGLRAGDLIIGIDGAPVDDPSVFDFRFATKPLGGETRIEVTRGGKEVTMSVALQPAPDAPRDELVITASSPFRGAKVSNLSPALAEELRLDTGIQGVVILDVSDAAERVGFQRGDVINTVNNEKIGKTRDLERAAGQPTRIWRITITRDGRQRSVTLGG